MGMHSGHGLHLEVSRVRGVAGAFLVSLHNFILGIGMVVHSSRLLYKYKLAEVVFWRVVPQLERGSKETNFRDNIHYQEDPSIGHQGNGHNRIIPISLP